MNDHATIDASLITDGTAGTLTRAAFIDIGSNSIRTMLAFSENGLFAFSEKAVHTTRLAEGLLQTGMLAQARMEQSLTVIRAFAEPMRLAGVPVYAYATSAVRDAGNRDRFAEEVRKSVDDLAILSGEQEARYAFLAATGGNGGMLDIGGGSTQAVTGQLARSFPLGCVRARDLCPAGTLSEIRTAIAERLDRIADFTGLHADRWSGVGGTITTLAALDAGLDTYDRSQVGGYLLKRDRLLALLTKLESLEDARAEIPLLKRRHDVILHGGAILSYCMDRLAFSTLCVSDTDGLEGYAIHVLERESAGKRI